MRRADRLFRIIQRLRSQRITTARQLADEMEVAERTIYRDIRDLTLCGVPVEGEAGVGYRLRRGFDIPPLMFTREEVSALTLGARILQSWADPALAKAAAQALDKIEAVLPERLRDALASVNLFSPLTRLSERDSARMESVRRAMDERSKMRIAYTRSDGAHSRRTIWPLGLFFWGEVWTLGGWCELRRALRNFRLDRIEELTILDERYPDTPGRRIEDIFEQERGRNAG